MALATPLSPPILPTHSFPLFLVQVSSGEYGIMGGVGFSSYYNEASPRICCSEDSEPKVATLSLLQIINDSFQLTSGFPGLLLISSLHPTLLHQALETAAGQMTVLAYG